MIRTVSLETAKKLKEAGFRQDAQCTWVNRFEHSSGGYSMMGKEESSDGHWDDCKWHITFNRDVLYQKEYYSSPTTDELLEELPYGININKGPFEYRVSYHIVSRVDNVNFLNKSLPEALAQMWLWLKAEKLI